MSYDCFAIRAKMYSLCFKLSVADLVVFSIVGRFICLLGGGQMYMWGKMKTNGDDWMYPKPLMDLRYYSNC